MYIFVDSYNNTSQGIILTSTYYPHWGCSKHITVNTLVCTNLTRTLTYTSTAKLTHCACYVWENMFTWHQFMLAMDSLYMHEISCSVSIVLDTVLLLTCSCSWRSATVEQRHQYGCMELQKVKVADEGFVAACWTTTTVCSSTGQILPLWHKCWRCHPT